MRSFSLLLCLSLAVVAVHAKRGKSWALLVASAKDWSNYGMQADVFHAYQVFRQGGIPEEQIVVMAYDDVVNSQKNPYKGKIFHTYDFHDVYKGVVIDYKGESSTKDVFIAALNGDKDAVKNLTGSAGKVIESGPDDNVFVFISDHGAPGLVSWWDRKVLTAKELNDAIKNLHTNKRYSNLVIYIDVCFSGSMFQNLLPDNIGVYAVTASEANKFSYSTDCCSKGFQSNPTCLGGLFSINFIYELVIVEHVDTTMDIQFQGTKAACAGKSVPQQYGNISIANKLQYEFFGDNAQNTQPLLKRRSRRSVEHNLHMPRHMLVYHTLKNQLAQLPDGSGESQSVAAELYRVETLMGHADRFFKDVTKAIHRRFSTDKYLAWAEKNFQPIKWSCYEPVVEAVISQCPRMMGPDEVAYYAFSKFGVLINMCNEVRTDMVIAAAKTAAKLNPLCDV